MPGCLLFCIAEGAKAFVRDVLDTGDMEGGARSEKDPGLYYLVESRDGPPDGQHFMRQLRDNEIFNTDFFGATPVDCQRWANERCRHDNGPTQDLITIVDARSAKDRTVSIQHYVRPPAGTEDFTFGEYGVLPRETNVWYDFRVDYRQAQKVHAALTENSPEVIFPIYFGNKETFTDENGVFNVAEAQRYCIGVDPDVQESEIYLKKFRTNPEGV